MKISSPFTALSVFAILGFHQIVQAGWSQAGWAQAALAGQQQTMINQKIFDDRMDQNDREFKQQFERRKELSKRKMVFRKRKPQTPTQSPNSNDKSTEIQRRISELETLIKGTKFEDQFKVFLSSIRNQKPEKK